MKSIQGWKRSALAGLLLLAGSVTSSAAVGTQPVQVPSTRLEQQIRKELITLPWFSVFDTLSYRVDGSTVTLYGHVTRPTLRSSAENVVKRLEGIETIKNEIEVLPLSPFDDRIRWSVYRSVYGYGPLQRYSLNPVAPIRITVKNGNVTLSGVVATEMDRNLAYIRANGVFGAFSVTNNLQVEQSS